MESSGSALPSAASSSFTTFVLPIAALTVAIYSFYRLLVYPLYLSPLSRIPNAHWSSAISPLWILYVRYTDNENDALLDAHQKLGPVVRLGPSDLSINSIDHVKTVYGGGFERTDWYSMFDNYGVPCMFSTVPSKEHALRKRMISNVYSKSFMQSSPAARRQARAILLGRLLPLLTASTAADQDPQGLEVASLFMATSMDFISAYIYGLRCGTDFLRNAAYREHWLQLYLNRHGASFYLQEVPSITRLMRAVLRTSPYPQWVDWATQELSEWNTALYNKAMAFLGNVKMDGNSTGTFNRGHFAESPEDEPVVLQSLLTNLERETATHGTDSLLYATAIKQPELAVQSELFDHILAGQETTGLGLTSLAWKLSLHQNAQDALREELLQLKKQTQQGGDDTEFFPTAKELDALPVLQAVIMETLRLDAPIETPQPRQIPPSGCRIGPYEVPGGVRIASQAHTLHRDESVFPQADEWHYARWLPLSSPTDDDNDDNDDAPRRAQARQFWAFSSGGRMCIGSNFAIQEMKEVAAMIYSRFQTHVVDDSGMEPDEGPVSEQLYLRFAPLT
ncbi:cytochrome p450 [Ophiostoma piceae UAMH 11346]|uniref:Cytochrome p450 n=1 Tax=Ophiostoma piceae (strain UAMH 11346) TaxID=1262450 RepID=S3CVX9_OPHP1|nr:cytochrome p450 [Ophiostoma piceae UAMH 11346]